MGKNCALGLEYGPRPSEDRILKTSGTAFSHADLTPGK